MMKRGKKQKRSWPDHLKEMQADKEWAEEAERARWEMGVFNKLSGEVRRAVQDTGYPSAEALRLTRQLGPQLAVETIWRDYRDAMSRS